MSAEPLQAFGRAKTEAVRLFNNLSELIGDVCSFFEKQVAFDEGKAPTITHSSANIGTPEQLSATRALQEKSDLIRDAVSRNNMKVVFVGRTSNGKSTTINAMLRARVLPSGSGHTTNCFCLVQGTPREQAYLISPGSSEEQDIKAVGQLAHAMSESGRLESNAIVNLYWPLRNCYLLENDVVLIDSPGLDMSQDLDGFIELHCTDADVFVLVSSFESSLSQTELNFFRRVASRISKPNIFVLFNRWDTIDEEENLSVSVHNQHMGAARAFLKDELQLQSEATLKTRVFPVSSREALQKRTNSLKNPGEEQELRYREFERFEESFKECISRSALSTRFHKHINSGTLVCYQVDDMIADAVQKLVGYEQHMRECLEDQSVALGQINSNWASVNEQANEIVAESKAKADVGIRNAVHANLAEAISEAITVFTDPSFKFSLAEYKARLSEHMDLRLREPLNSAFRRAAADCYQSQLKRMRALTSVVLPDQCIPDQALRGTYEATISINCASLMASFDHHIGFEFSLSLDRIAPGLAATLRELKIANPRNWGAMMHSAETRRAAAMELVHAAFVLANNSVVWLVSVPVSYLVRRHYRVCFALVGLYGAVCTFEFLQYKMINQEDVYKSRYLDFLHEQLRNHIVGSASNTAQGIEESLRKSHGTIAKAVASRAEALESEIEDGQKRAGLLQSALAKGKELLERTNGIRASFAQFLKDFIPAAVPEPRPIERTISAPVGAAAVAAASRPLPAAGRMWTLGAIPDPATAPTPPNSAPATSPDPTGPQPLAGAVLASASDA